MRSCGACRGAHNSGSFKGLINRIQKKARHRLAFLTDSRINRKENNDGLRKSGRTGACTCFKNDRRGESISASLQFACHRAARIHEYNWWNESSHGVARCGTATVFPHSIGLAATFDGVLIHDVADVISTEARVKYNQHEKYGDYDIYKGLTFWAPNINIFRDRAGAEGRRRSARILFLLLFLPRLI